MSVSLSVCLSVYLSVGLQRVFEILWSLQYKGKLHEHFKELFMKQILEHIKECLEDYFTKPPICLKIAQTLS